MLESESLWRAEPATEAVPAGPLPLVARIWLGFDGTISSFLRAACGEPIVSRVLSAPPTRRFTEAEDWAWPAARALDRVVLRCGERSGKPYYHAHSTLALDRLPEAAEALLRSEVPLAAALRRLRIDTTYVPVSSRWTRIGSLAALFDLPEDSAAGELCYTINAQGLPLGLVREVFPFQGLPQS